MPTYKLKFTATHGFPQYHAHPGPWKNGDIRDVEVDEAKRLTSQFPDNFTKVEPKDAPEKLPGDGVPKKDAEDDKPTEKADSTEKKDKALRPTKNKGGA